MSRKILVTLLINIALIANSFAIDNNPKNNAKKVGEIKGIIIDAISGSKIEYASVALYDVETGKVVEGGLSDSKGYFDFLKIKKGNYRVQIDFIGYKRYSSDGIIINRNSKKVDLGTIKLQPDVAVIGDVTVTAERTYIENKIDKKVVNIGKDLLTAGASASDIMMNLPSVDVDIEGNVSLRGNENVRILVDGRPTNMSSEELLATIPAENIDKVEIITNPSAKYDPDGISGILNIILKKDKKLGFNGSANAGIGSANEFSGVNKYNGSVNLTYNKGNWNIFANYGYRDDERESGGTFNRNLYDDTGAIKNNIEQESNSVRNRLSNSLKTGVDYTFANKDILGYTANIRSSNRNRFEELEYTTSPFELRESERNFDTKSLSHDLIYKHEIDEETKYEINAYREDTKQNSDSNFESEVGNIKQPTEKDNTDENNNLTTVQFDFTKETDDYKLEFGVKGHARNIDSDYQYFTTSSVADPNRSNHFIFNEQIYSAYTNYGKKWEKWAIQAGVRIEQALTESKLAGETPYENDYFNFYPSVFLTRKIGERNEIGFSYSKRVSRPSTRQLNPAQMYSDTLNIKMGNPNLNPEFTNSLEVSYTRHWKGGSFNSAVFYRQTSDKIQRIKIVDEFGVSTTTFGNIATAQEIGLEASVMTKIYKWWSINASTNLYYSNLDTDNPNFSNDGINWFSRLNNTFNITPTWSLQASGMYMAERVIPQGHIEPMYKADLGVKKTILNKRGTIGFRVSDVFNTFNFSYYTDGKGFSEVGNRNWESRVAYLTFSYSFGETQRNKRKERRERDGGDDMDNSF